MARPWKYDKLIRALEDDILYHTAKVLAHGEQLGHFTFSMDDPERRLSEIEIKNAMKNAQSSLAHFVVKYLPQEPDGFVAAAKPARVMYPGWYGWRWKQKLQFSIDSKIR